MKLRASEIIRPQSGVGGETPNPRNDSELNASNIHDQRMAPSTSRTSSTLGRSSQRTMVDRLSPRARAAVTKSTATTSCVAARAILITGMP